MSAVIPEEQRTAPQLVLGIALHVLLRAAGLLPALQRHLTVTYLPVSPSLLLLFVPLGIFKCLFFTLFPARVCPLSFPQHPHQATAWALRELQDKTRFSAAHFGEK